MSASPAAIGAAKAGRVDRTIGVYLRLRHLIVHGQLAPGSRVVESEVARKLGVSRTPVRSALQRLQQEGFIVAGGGGELNRPVVAPLTREDALEIFEMVGTLEGLAAARAARLPVAGRAEAVKRLEEANRELEALHAHTHPDQGHFFELDSVFHSECVTAGAGPRLKALHHAVKPHAERYARLYVSILQSEIPTSVAEHQRVIEGIRRGAPQAARDAVFENWRNAAGRLSRVIDSAGERGSW